MNPESHNPSGTGETYFLVETIHASFTQRLLGRETPLNTVRFYEHGSDQLVHECQADPDVIKALSHQQATEWLERATEERLKKEAQKQIID